jgi:hypothetical protein
MVTKGSLKKHTRLLNPRNGADRVVSVGEIAETVDGCIMGGPQIDAAAEADSENVCAGPVDKIKVKVLCQFWGVEDAVGCLADVAELAAGAFEKLATFCADGAHGVCRIGGGIEPAGRGGRG